ncbi:MAG: hypothetical protein Roseis2KO_60240 [Roseivirga sp.]
MAKVRILIIEDELLVAEDLRGMLTGEGYDVLEIADNATDAKRALNVYQLDIVLIDIMLKGEEDGIDIAEYIRQNHRLPIIFTSSLIDAPTIERARSCQPAAYLVKPYNLSSLFIAIDMALFNFQSHQTAAPFLKQTGHEQSHYTLNDHIFIKDKHRFERIRLTDILFLKAESSYVSIITTNKNYLLTTETLKSFLDKLTTHLIQRVHRSYAVNIEQVEALEGNRLILGTHEIPVGKNYHAALPQMLKFL